MKITNFFKTQTFNINTKRDTLFHDNIAGSTFLWSEDIKSRILICPRTFHNVFISSH